MAVLAGAVGQRLHISLHPQLTQCAVPKLFAIMLLEGLHLEPSEVIQREGGARREGMREFSLSVPSPGYIKHKTNPLINLPIDFSGIS